MILIHTAIGGLEVYVLLVSDNVQRCFFSHGGAITAAQDYVL